MRITRVQAENLKGRTFGYDLEPQVAIVGENFTGKTSIIDAIRLALIGYIPELGKLPKATRQLMSDEFMTIHLEFDNGSNADFEMNGGKHELAWAIDRKEIPLLNAASYFGMSERERYQYVFEIAKIPDSFSRGSISTELQELMFESAAQPAKDKIVASVDCAMAGCTVQEGLQKAIDELAGYFKYYNARAKDSQGAVRILTELKNRQEAMAGNAKQFADNERIAMAAAREAWDTLNLTRRRVVDAVKWKERNARNDDLRKITQSTEETEKLEQLIAEATKQLKPEVDSKYSEQDVDDLSRAHEKVLREFNEYSVNLRDRTAERKALDEQSECPHCGAKSKGWKDRLRNNLDSSVLMHRGAVDGAARTLVERKAELDAAIAEMKRAREDLAFNKQLNEKIVGWQGQIDTLLRRRHEWDKTIEKEEKALAETKVEPVSEKELFDAEAENNKAEATYKLARQRLKEAELLEQDIKRAAQSQMEHESAVTHVTVIKAIGKVLREKQAALVTTVFGDLLHIANKVVGEILESDLAFHEGEIGRWDGHRWITHKTFSGTEQALTFVGVAAALSQGAPIRLLIFDEVGRLDDLRRRDLLNLLIAARKEGFIDQWIVAGTDMPENLPESIQVIQL